MDPAEKNQPLKHRFHSETPKIIQWLIKYSGGLIKNEKQAYYVLLGFVIIAVIISFYLILSGVEAPNIIKGTEYKPYEGYGGKQLPDEFR